MWAADFLFYFIGLSLICALVIWTWCYVLDMQMILAKVVPRRLRDYVVFENFFEEGTQLRPHVQHYRNKTQKAFLQMIVIEIILAPVLFPVNFLISYQVIS